MVSYTCQTCQAQGLEEIGKHFSLTRHKTAIYDELVEIIRCEECEDSNIHLIRMIRYGLSDISLLCEECSKKLNASDVLATYSLSNGSLFSKLPQYYKLRDIQCTLCLLEKGLHVSNDGNQQYIFCKSCIDEKDLRGRHVLVCETDDSFLYALLGIKEYVPKSGLKLTKRARKTGRKGGRERRPKKVDPNAEERRKHYEAKMATKAQFQLGKTVKAVGSSGATPTQSRSVTPKPPSRTATPKNPKPKSQESADRKSKVAEKKPLKPAKNGKEDIKSKSEKAAKNKPPHIKGQVPSKQEHPVSKESQKAVSKKENGTSKKAHKAHSLQETENDSNLPNINGNGPVDEANTKRKISKQKTNSAGQTDRKVNKNKIKDSNKAETSTQESKPAKKGSKSTPKSKSPVQTQSEKPVPTHEGTPEIKQPAPSKPLVLPPGISQYTPESEPPLSFPDLTTYFNEMCYNLFLEEKAQLDSRNPMILSHEEFSLEWYAENNLKHKQYKAQVLLTPELLDRFLTKNMQAVKASPFTQDQSVILVLDGRIPWYGRIAMVDTFSPGKPSYKKGRGKPRPTKNLGPQITEMAVELYSWNTMPLPTTMDVKHLQLLPVSVPVSRVFYAMLNLLNPKFIDLVLGNKEVKQLKFKNYIQLTKDTFNESQKIGLQSVLNNSITVLQGPPGTGKTSTIHEIILQLLEKMNTSPILVVAASNIAIDNIAEKLIEKHGKSILRIVSLQKEIEYNRDHPLASICLHHKVYDGLSSVHQDRLRSLRRPDEKLGKNAYSQLMSAIIDYSNTVIRLSKVILTTTVTAGGLQLKALPKIPVVIMDEATQSSEPTTLIPLSMTGVDKFVFVGDHKQLSSFSDIPNLSLSLFERILRNGTYKTPHMLDTQYRMHPAISEFPRRKFYDNLLKDGITAEDRAKPGIPSNPIVFWDTEGKRPEKTVRTRFRGDMGMTYANEGEIELLEKILTTLIFDKGIKKSDIGVITPYRGQRDLISSVLVKNDLINPDKDVVHENSDRDDFYSDSRPLTIHTVSDIMIASIDAFQGREKDFMIMSCVRSNAEQKVGFLKDERRLNVALTRARYGLIIVGDAACLRNDPLWKEYIDGLESKGLLINGSEFLYT